jgi:hypothetical protein
MAEHRGPKGFARDADPDFQFTEPSFSLGSVADLFGEDFDHFFCKLMAQGSGIEEEGRGVYAAA